MDKVSTEEQGNSVHGVRFTNLKCADATEKIKGSQNGILKQHDRKNCKKNTGRFTHDLDGKKEISISTPKAKAVASLMPLEMSKSINLLHMKQVF